MGTGGPLLLELAGGGGCRAVPTGWDGLLGRLGGGVSDAVLDGRGGWGGGASSVDLVGLGGCGGGASSSSRLVGSLGGPSLEGNASLPLATGRTGVEFTDKRGALPLTGLFPISAFVFSRRLGGGRTGSFDGSKGGGSFLCVSTEEVLVLEDAVRD